ncbi:TetR family transcriptional regulator [Lysinibacillus sp. KCTC 33748]|uniref:TetR/AcrR family transcriptional regulator n=1 Tax=unclassified Lysinibacillus TaxID=2636778 RepID=UPI0009A5713D|nr:MULTISPECIES: TetR/AcrR family transcriptional regulator [unclassified Lysinibacillus]OXS73193.1 TetR family transcriptional regulator [Lysinibacillus sp. KCTC 33748]SKB82346.1 transcriptional regulator, TetR family [Lysinibacillus sp. AC-3]
METKLTNDEKKKRKRSTILNAAIKLYSDTGFAETKVADISKEAGVSFGTVFTYFDSKEALYESAILEPLKEIKPYFIEIGEHFKGDPLEVVKEMIDCHVQLFSMKSEYLRLIQQVLARPDRFPKLFKELDDFVKVFINSIYPVIEEGQRLGYFYEESPSLIAESYLSILNGMRLTFIDEYTNVMRKDISRQALRLFGPIKNN